MMRLLTAATCCTLWVALLCLHQSVHARVHDSIPLPHHKQVVQQHPVHVNLPAVLNSLNQQQVRDDADQIINELVNGAYKGLTYARLANFTDTIGPRVCGSEGEPLGKVDLAQSPDRAGRKNDIDYDVMVKGKRHQLLAGLHSLGGDGHAQVLTCGAS